MKKKYFLYGLLFVAVGSLILYRISENRKKENFSQKTGNPGKPQTMQVNGLVVQPVRFTNSISVTGSIDANEQVQITSQVSGIVDGIYFKEGSKVGKGQLLLKINDAELRAQLLQASTRQGLSEANEGRIKQLLQTKVVSQQEYDVALADLKGLQAQTQLIQAQLAKTSIRAPFAGTIGLRSISAGEYLSPQTVVANLVSTQPVKITFSVPEKYSGQVKVNSTIVFSVPGSDKKFEARVYAQEPLIDKLTRTLQLRALADNPNNVLLPGTFVNIALPLAILDNAILLPTEAIVPVQNGKKVFLAKNGKAQEALITTTARTDKDVLVSSGLQAGDTVLTSGVMTLKNGTLVKVSLKPKIEKP